MGALVLLILVTCDYNKVPTCDENKTKTGEECHNDGYDDVDGEEEHCPAVYNTWQFRVGIMLALPTLFCMCRRNKPRTEQQQADIAQQQRITTPWAATPATAAAAAGSPVVIACPSCRNAFRVQRPAGSAAGAAVVQCPHCQTQLQF